MTNKELAKWLRAHYQRGSQINRIAFLADVDATLEALGAEPISLAQINHWLSRNPPADIAGRSFEEFLALTLERKDNPEAPARIYTVSLALSAEEDKILRRTAKRARSTPEVFLGLCLRIGFEDECGIE